MQKAHGNKAKSFSALTWVLCGVQFAVLLWPFTPALAQEFTENTPEQNAYTSMIDDGLMLQDEAAAPRALPALEALADDAATQQQTPLPSAELLAAQPESEALMANAAALQETPAAEQETNAGQASAETQMPPGETPVAVAEEQPASAPALAMKQEAVASVANSAPEVAIPETAAAGDAGAMQATGAEQAVIAEAPPEPAAPLPAEQAVAEPIAAPASEVAPEVAAASPVPQGPVPTKAIDVAVEQSSQLGIAAVALDAVPAPSPEAPLPAVPQEQAMTPESTSEEASPVTGAAEPDAAHEATEVVHENNVEKIWSDGEFIRELQHGERILLLPKAQEQDADTYEPLTIDEAIALALHNNYEGKAAQTSSEAAYWEKLATYSLYGPTLEARYAAGHETSSPASYNDSTGVRKKSDSHTRRDQLYSIRQPIIDMATVEDILLKKVREDYAKSSERDARESIAFDTVNAYLNLIQASLGVKLAGDYYNYLERLEERMQARVDGGGATPGDLERVQGRMTNAQSAQLEAQGEFENTLAEFRRLTHVTPSRLAISDEMTPAIPGLLSDAVAHAEISNPAYIGMTQKVDMAKRSRDQSYAGMLPTLNFEYGQDHAYNAGGSANGNPVDGVYPMQDNTRFMLVAHWSLNGGYNAMNGVAGGSRVQEAKYRAMDARMRLEQAVRSSYNAVNAANKRMDVVKKGLSANAHVVQEFEDQQENGRRSLFELLDAYEQLYASRLSMMRLVTARAQAAYLVHRQMGTLLTAMQQASIKQPMRQAN